MRFALAVAALALVYALALASADPWDLVLGAVLAALGLWLFRGLLGVDWFAHRTGVLGRLIWSLPLAVAVAREIVRGTWSVASVVMGVRPLRRPGIVAVPIDERSEFGAGVSMLIATLSPGSYLVDVDLERGCMLLHVLDAADPDGVREDLRRFYETYQRRVFP